MKRFATRLTVLAVTACFVPGLAMAAQTHAGRPLRRRAPKVTRRGCATISSRFIRTVVPPAISRTTIPRVTASISRAPSTIRSWACSAGRGRGEPLFRLPFEFGHELVGIVGLDIAVRFLPLRQRLVSRQFSYGTCVKRCEITFRRARCLSSERTTNHGAHGVSVALNMSSRARE